MSMMTCQGYQAVIVFDDEAELFHGEVAGLRDVVTFQGSSVAELKQAFADSIADYLAFCKERGEEPGLFSSGPAIIADPGIKEEDKEPIWPTRAQEAFNVAQAEQLKEQAEVGGLRFEAFLTSQDASWLLELVRTKVFIDPADAIAVIVSEARELHPHKDLRRELLRRMLQVSIDDPRPGIPIDEAFARLKERMALPRPEPAEWERYKHQE